MLAYEKALEWQDLFDVAVQQQNSNEDLQATAYRVAGKEAFASCHNPSYSLKLISYRGPFIEEEVSRSRTRVARPCQRR